ncbi:sigma-54 interaction domain-containing protein [Solidesulfovibrio sp.]
MKISLENDTEKLKVVIETVGSIINSITGPLAILNSDLVVIKANVAFCKMFNMQQSTTEGTSIFAQGQSQDELHRLRELFSRVLTGKSQFYSIDMPFYTKSAGPKILHLSAHVVHKTDKDPQLIVLSAEDVTHIEQHKDDSLAIIKERALNLVAAQEESDKRQVLSDAAFSEIKQLKDQLEAERAYLQDEIKLEYNHEDIIGKSEAIKNVFYKVEQIAGTDTNVLVLGETGTGKELVARAIHSLSLRKDRALVKMNCAALPSNLIESELFGHEKGAFTGAHSRRLGRFEVANGATLFLDEIGELPLELQPKLLRVIQNGEFERLGSSNTIKVNVRIIAATNRNLEEEVRKGYFRDDLWYRLNVFPITVPPLRERTEDIPLLVDYFVKKIAKRLGKTIEFIPLNVMHALQNYHWPGNIRELENVLERGVINSSGPKLRLIDELKKPFKSMTSSQQTLESVEREYILLVLAQTNWKVGGKDSAAEILGLDRSTLRARMRKLNIQKP